MGLIKVKVKELAMENGWSLREVSERSGVGYSTVRHYARGYGICKVDYTAILRLADTFNVLLEDLVEVVEEYQCK